MSKRIAPISVISLVLLAACGALSQSERRTEGLLQRDGTNSLEVQSQEMGTWRSIPDAPSTVQPPRQAEKFQTFAYESRSHLTIRTAGISSGQNPGTELRGVTPGPQPSLIASYELRFTQKESSNFIVKYSCPTLVKRTLLYHPSTSSTFMGRAAYAASHMFVARNDSGKNRLNTSYFIGVLSSVAIHSARRPIWARATSAPFNDFGSTIGNDAEMNLFREFGPGIRQTVKGHMPKFAFKIGERITHDQNLKEVPSPAR